MIRIPLKGVWLLDLDQVDMCLEVGEETAREHLPELVELCDASLPKRWARWWQSTVDKFTVNKKRLKAK
jgi:hypothetical protein